MTLYHMYNSHQDWLETNIGDVALVYWQLTKVVELHGQKKQKTLCQHLLGKGSILLLITIFPFLQTPSRSNLIIELANIERLFCILFSKFQNPKIVKIYSDF